MRNYPKNTLVGCGLVLMGAFAAIFYFINELGYGYEYFVYVGSCFLIAFTALMGGSMVGSV